jgi:hypothetical protein
MLRPNHWLRLQLVEQFRPSGGYALERFAVACTDLFFVAERRLSLGRRFNAGVACERNPRVAQRRLKGAKNSQSQSSLRDWKIIRPLNRR